MVKDEPAAPYQVLSSTTVYRSGHVIDVRRDELAQPGAEPFAREVIVHPGAVGIVALDHAGQVLLLRQYRHPVGRMLWEVPAGLLDIAGEDPLVGAQRELFEEAYLRAARWDVMIDIFTSPGMTDEAIRIYLARDLSEPTEPRFVGHHEEADMPLCWMPLDEAVRAAQRGDLHNPITVVGVLGAHAAAQEAFAGLRPAHAPWPEMSAFTGSASATPAQ